MPFSYEPIYRQYTSTSFKKEVQEYINIKYPDVILMAMYDKTNKTELEIAEIEKLENKQRFVKTLIYMFFDNYICISRSEYSKLKATDKPNWRIKAKDLYALFEKWIKEKDITLERPVKTELYCVADEKCGSVTSKGGYHYTCQLE